MARGKAYVQRTSFVGGLVTEANPLTQTDNTCQEISNITLKRNGDILRRFGIERETGYTETNTGRTASDLGGDKEYIATVEFLWDNPGGENTLTFAVVQVGHKLYFYNTTVLAPSSDVSVLDLNSSGVSLLGRASMSFASVSGSLVVVSNELEFPLVIKYEKDTGTFAVSAFRIEVRDLWGIDDGLAPHEKQRDPTSSHVYNLINQGWGELPSAYTEVSGTLIPTKEAVSSTDISKIQEVYEDRDSLPTNSEVQALYNTDPEELIRINSTLAPKGRVIIDAFDRAAGRDRTTKYTAQQAFYLGYDEDTGIDEVLIIQDAPETDLEQGKLSTIASFGDRIFYSGVVSDVAGGDTRSPDYSGFVFFSKIVKSNTDLGKCYQEADPTSEDFSDLVATDGGYINITGANKILKLEQLGGFLVVFAENGVWAIGGADGVFRANDYSITKLTSTGAISSLSIVSAQNALFFWSQEGIFTVTVKEVTNDLQVTSLINNSIQTYYNDISSTAKLYAKGTFDRVNQTIRWLYNSTDAYDGVINKHNYNKELLFDSALNAWYTYDFGVAGIRGYITTSPYSSVLNVENVTHEGDNVTYAGEQVTYTTKERSTALSQIKYLIDGYSSDTTLYLTLGTLTESSFLDWADNPYVNSGEGVDAEGSLLTSWILNGDTTRRKDIEYLHLFLRRTETGVDADGNALSPSSCLFRVRWDFSDSSTSNKFSSQREGYRYKRMYTVPVDGTLDYGKEVIVTKNRVRGSGKALSIEITTSPGKDLHLHGWAISLLGNQEE